jgi:hypothetical protein
MREVVRSGRRANFYTTENSFIDHYARDVGTTGVAVYHVLERHANCDTHSTWIGTAKMAELLNLDQRTIQRTIKKLESLRLIRIVRSANLTVYYIVPVPPRAKTASIPLFDELYEPMQDQGDTDVVSTTPPSQPATVMSHKATLPPQANDIDVAPYKEEQDLLNKTYQQENPENIETAQRVLNILKLPDTFMSAAIAAVEVKLRRTNLSTDAVVQEIVTAANHAERRGIPRHKFLEDFLAQTSAEQIVDELHLPATKSLISTVTAAVKAEVAHRGLSTEKIAALIISAAREDGGRGIQIDRFYFENTKWRNGNGTGQGKGTAERNLDAAINARNSARRALGLDH